jgi:protein-S-isoprenylcysteine O-methyltransferase Ste14
VGNEPPIVYQEQENGNTESYAERAARLRVREGFFLAAIFLIWARPTPAGLVSGGAIALAGLLLRAWGAGCLEKDRRLATGGPYAYTRNPLYLGSALAGLGFAIAAGRWWFLVLLVTFFATVYWPVMRHEQARLERLFPEEFPLYAQAVPMFWPRLRPWTGSGSAVRFDLARYRRNREDRALLGSLVIVLFLCARMYWN